MTRTRLMGLLLCAILVAAGCSSASAGHKNDRTPSTQDISFTKQILPLLQNKFAPLLEQESGLSLDSWESLIAGSDFGEILIPFDADNSLLIRLATQQDPAPPAAQNITSDEISLMRQWINEGAKNDNGAVPYADATQLLYSCNQGAAEVAVIDMESNLVIRTVKLKALGFSENAKPHHTAVEPDGSFWYLSMIGEHKVLKFNRDNELVGQVDFEVPGMLALHPTEDYLFVGRSMMAVNPPQRIGMVRRSDMTIEEVDVFFPRPHALTIDPRGEVVYSASLAQNQLASVGIADQDLEVKSLGGDVHTLVQFAASPDGKTLVAGGQVSGKFLFFDNSNPMELELVETIDVNAAPWHPIFSPDGKYVYFANKMANSVTVVDVENRKVDGIITGEGLSQPHGSALSPDGKTLYISSNNLKGAYKPRYNFGPNEKTGAVVVINTESREIERVIEVRAYASGLGSRTPTP